MATLERIRSWGPVLVIIIGFALLAFILSGLLNDGKTYFGQSRNVVARIDGEKFKYEDFNALIAQFTNAYKIENGSSDVGEEAQTQIRNNAWQYLLQNTQMTNAAEKIGMTVSPKELSDYLFGNNIHPIIQRCPLFYDAQGHFSTAAIKNFMDYLQQTPQTREQQEQRSNLQAYWDYLVNNVRFDILQKKYFTLIGKSVVANNLEAKQMYDAERTTSDANFIEQPYFTVADSLVNITDADVKAFFEKHKQWFKLDESRTLNYVVFELKPSQADYKETEDIINKYAEEFKTTNDVAGVVNLNSDIMYNDRSVYSRTTVPPYLKDFAFSGKTGDVTGPFFHDDTYTMARIMETGINSPDSVRLRHIYIIGDNSEQKADSLMDVILAGGNFAALAKQFSAVTQTADKGGEIGWFTRDMYGGMLTKDMILDAFKSNTGDVTSYDMEQGTQIIQAYEKSAPRNKVRLAILERKVIPSSETESNIFNEARQLLTDSKNNIDDFEKAAKAKNYIVRTANDVLKSAYQIGTVQEARQVVRRAFENKKGKVLPEVFQCKNQYVVVAVADANNTGYQTLATATPMIKAQLIREKKGDMIAKQIAEKMKQNTDLNSLAAALSVDVKQAAAVNFTSQSLGEAGLQEPAVIGKISALKPNQISTPVIGNSGVYVVQVTNQTDSTAVFNQVQTIQGIEMQRNYYLPYMVWQYMLHNAKIDDNRLNFY
ncbi:MAG: SurA N-terminal domain-containing protein [Paludibacter sp.]|nr:SurA N-terminal domain-containing protein [Paludibacter sp.]